MKFKRSVQSALTVLSVIVAVGCLGDGTLVSGQVTEPGTGYIKSENNWLVLGPFSEPFWCTTNDEDLLTLHLAPSSIHNMAPQAGEVIAYDPALASTRAYLGPRADPGGGPQWRVFSDNNDDGEIDLNVDFNGNFSCSVMSYLVTYVEYLRADNPEIFLCMLSDDGVQTWWDTQLVYNYNACRFARAIFAPTLPCHEVAGPVKVTKGVHRIALGIWNVFALWRCSLALLDWNGIPILEGNPDWIFHGIDPRGLRFSGRTFPCREVSVPGNPAICPPPAGGPLTVKISQPLGSDDPGEEVQVKDVASGPFGPGAVKNATHSPSVSPKLSGPPRPVGAFADWQVLSIQPSCSGKPGEGSVTYDAGSAAYSLKNIGEEVGTYGDSFTFAYNQVKGDFTFMAHVASRSFVPGSRWGKLGLMARHDLSTRSRSSFAYDVGEDQQDETQWGYRVSHGNNDDFEISDVLPDGTHHDWLRIKRAGSLFSGYSWDGASTGGGGDPLWIQLGEHDWGPGARDTVLVGLAACSHTSNCLEKPMAIDFDQVSLKLPPGSAIMPIGPEPDGVELNWRVTREALAGGLSYQLDLDRGKVTFQGAVDNFSLLGDGVAIVNPESKDFGPLDLDSDGSAEFTHAHFLGRESPCPEANVSIPEPGCLEITTTGNIAWQERGGDQFPSLTRRSSATSALK